MKRVKGTPYWEVTAIPITPYKDDLSFDPLQVARVTVRNARTNKILAVQPKVVVPVSDEMRCDLCHGPVDTAGSILQAHDAANATHLYTDLQAGVRHACSECHEDNALGAPGLPGVKPLSQAIHGAHADKMDDARRRRLRHALLHVPPRRTDEVPARPHGAGGVHLHQRRLPRRHGAGRRQPGGADQQAGLAAGAHVRRLPRRQVRGEPGRSSTAIRT